MISTLLLLEIWYVDLHRYEICTFPPPPQYNPYFTENSNNTLLTFPKIVKTTKNF
jgi:hypothetical protein